MVQKRHQEEISGPLDTIEAAPLAKDLPRPKRARIESRKALENRAQTAETEVLPLRAAPQSIPFESGISIPLSAQNKPLLDQTSSSNRQKRPSTREKKEEWQIRIESTRNKAEKLKILSKVIGPPQLFPEKLKVPTPSDPGQPFPNKLYDQSNYDPLSLFHRFIPSELFPEIADYTNQYARQDRAKEAISKGREGRRRRPWKNVTATEIGGYIGAILFISAQSGERNVAYY